MLTITDFKRQVGRGKGLKGGKGFKRQKGWKGFKSFKGQIEYTFENALLSTIISVAL